jgi:hypothetical protein
VRYPVPQVPDHGLGTQSVFMSASGSGAHAWTSPSHSQSLEPAEEELFIFSHESSYEDDDDPWPTV